jgi:hypothetical protein
MKTYELFGYNSQEELFLDKEALEIAYALPFMARQDLSDRQVTIAQIIIDYLREDKALIVPFESFCAVRDGKHTPAQKEEWENYKSASNALVARYQAQLRAVVEDEDIEDYISSNHFIC